MSDQRERELLTDVLSRLDELDDIESKFAFMDVDRCVKDGARVTVAPIGRGAFEVELVRPYPSGIRLDYGRGATQREAIVDLWRNMYRSPA